ncbi:DUF4114 domain-containing protein [Dongia sp.]|uniref:DUF4114 domain-containing protein n=1 Tax=Dongia sp. TaxID=1977262 RepID=UPI0035AE51C7
MAQLVKLGKFLVEIDGTHLAFFDTTGNPQGRPQDLAQATQLTLPDGTTMPVDQFTELLAGDPEDLANFQTAAGGPGADQPTEADSGGGRFAVFEDAHGIGGLASVGGLQQTDQPSTPDLDTQSRRADVLEDDIAPLQTVLANEAAYLAPEVTAEGGKVEYHTTVTTGKQNPLGDLKVGDYLTKGGSEGKAIDPAMVNGVDSRNLTLAQSAEVKLGFVSEGAGYKSMVGVYAFDANGNIVPDSVKLVWLDASQVKQGVAGGALGKDFLGNSQPSEISLGNVAADTRLGFFIVADGASNKNNQKLLGSIADNDKADNYDDDLAAINQHLSFAMDAKGNGRILVDGKPLAGNIYFTHDKSLNTDGNSNDIEHTLSGTATPNDGKLYVGFEDLAGGGDRDYQDVVISVDMGSYNINKLTQTVTQPSVDLNDADSTHLAGAVITTDGFQPGDNLNVPDNPLFDVSVTHDGDDLTITIAAKAGVETIEAFEDFINHVYFSTTSTDESSREISYEVTDADSQHSNVSTVAIEFSHSSDDLLHLDVQEIGQYHDLGAGHDTVQLGQDNMSFGHGHARMLDNVEVIDARGAGHNDISISIDDVLDMTEGNHHLTILGQKGDSLTLTGDGWTATDHGDDFTTYTFNDGVHQAVVEVSNQMAQIIV